MRDVFGCFSFDVHSSIESVDLKAIHHAMRREELEHTMTIWNDRRKTKRVKALDIEVGWTIKLAGVRSDKCTKSKRGIE